ncbi:hypothetical protein LY90DRAFT_512368 [Neocallimastix californiae]|uniref:Uncharacterized protein n=1 Tax=Neocallimastix californiae TaxID=1754190 RepID=A0A1Y2BBN2_9FUNG|nr:hypothetical protein LY90DRAFT_512368 [Neocallimastix californiae]|eukprot:ORY31887.1 hypothetical protein LY90DRAFT_512368 [Neocallimastix californiae]
MAKTIFIYLIYVVVVVKVSNNNETNPATPASTVTEKEIKEGTHPEFLSKIEKLDKARQEAIQFHEYMKECRIHCTNVLYENEIKAAMDEYMQEIQGLREKMLENIENKKRKLKEESENDIIHVHQGVPFLLKENEIADDMNILKKGSYVPPVKKSGKGKKK